MPSRRPTRSDRQPVPAPAGGPADLRSEGALCQCTGAAHMANGNLYIRRPSAFRYTKGRSFSMPVRHGGCLCGQVRFTVTADPVISRICWCKDCQHLSGNGTANAIFPSESIEIEGSTAEYSSKGDSGNTVRRRFCARCGSHLFADSTGRSGLTVVRLGTLDDPSSIRPVANIWAHSAPAWACLDPALTRIEGQPLPPQSPGAS